MRNILWRLIALALACALSWLMWNWPEPSIPVEFVLERDSNMQVPHTKEINDTDTHCVDGTRVKLREMQYSAEQQAQILKMREERAEANRPVAEDERCIVGQRFYRVRNGWTQIGTCQDTVGK